MTGAARGQAVRTFCRICEPSCGLVADVDDGVLVKLSPDRDHPVTKGFACHKGLAAVDVHHDPDRLDVPLIREPDGSLRRASWDEAMAEVGARLQAIIGAHGSSAVGAYLGNPLAFNALGEQHVVELLRGLGVKRRFSAGTQDCANKWAASEAVFGTRSVHPIPDLRHTDLCIVIGENPRVSQTSFFSVPNVLGEMRRAAGRGSRFVFVNPRRIETPDRGVGDTVLIRPDTDVWFLAALLHEIDRLGGFDASIVARHGRNIDGLRAFLAPYPADAVSPVTGIDASTIRELAHAWTSTPRASVHASTGLNMGRQGTLAYWLVHMLSFVTGRLDRDGGNLKSDGFYPNARSGSGDPRHGYVDTEFGRLRRGGMPGTLLSHSILDSDEPMRAMIVVAGNPLLSIPGEERLREAFGKLEFLVSVDIYPNATSELAHVLLPATDMYERDDLNVINVGTSARPFAQYSPAVVAPQAMRRPEWWIAHRLLQEMGRPSLLDDAEPDPWAKLRYMLRTGSSLELDDLQETGEPVLLPEPTPGAFYVTQVRTPDQRVDCCPPTFAEAIDRCHRFFDEANASRDGDRLLLIHGRDPWMHNSWFANVSRMKRPGRHTNPLSMHPDDAAARGLVDGQPIRVTSASGEIDSTVALDEALMPGVVSMVHGWGHRASPSLGIASTYPGSNPNALLPIGEGSYEPLSSQAHMTGIPVTVTAAAPAHTAPG